MTLLSCVFTGKPLHTFPDALLVAVHRPLPPRSAHECVAEREPCGPCLHNILTQRASALASRRSMPAGSASRIGLVAGQRFQERDDLGVFLGRRSCRVAACPWYPRPRSGSPRRRRGNRDRSLDIAQGRHLEVHADPRPCRDGDAPLGGVLTSCRARSRPFSGTRRRRPPGRYGKRRSRYP